MDTTFSTLQDTFSDAGVSQHPHPTTASTSLDLQSCNHILSIILAHLRMSELLVRDFPTPRCIWELEQEVQVQLGAGALNVDQDMVQELTKTFQEPSLTLEVTVSSSPNEITAELYLA